MRTLRPTSDRERRLWRWTLLVVAAIFSTLGVATTFAGWLSQTGAAASFLFCMALVGVAVVVFGLNTRPSGLEIGVGIGVLCAYMMVFVRMTIVAERSHLIEYGVVALFIHEALKERASNGRRVPLPGVLAVAATSLIGVSDELIQALLPSRVFDPQDIVFNVLAAVMAVSASAALSWARRFTRRRRGVGP